MSSTETKRACSTCETVYDHHSQPGVGGSKPSETFTIGLVAVNFTSCYVCRKSLTLSSTFLVPGDAKDGK